jgi:hypothetical protein
MEIIVVEIPAWRIIALVLGRSSSRFDHPCQAVGDEVDANDQRRAAQRREAEHPTPKETRPEQEIVFEHLAPQSGGGTTPRRR